MRTRIALLGVLVLVQAAVQPSSDADAGPPVGRYQEFGDAAGFLNILPPGQDGVLNGPEAAAAQAGQYPPHVRDQLSMYGDLVYNTPGLTAEHIPDFFKDASFGVKEDDIDRVYSPTADVVVVRDLSYGVPHIFGETRYATMFAQGYTGAEDRLFVMDTLRHLGRARLSEFLGASEANQAFDREQLAVAPYTEADLTAQLVTLQNSGAEGQAGYADLLAYTDGVNAYINEAILDATKLPAEYPALQTIPEVWVPEDAVAIASLVGAIFGKGGGGELTNFCGLQDLTDQAGDASAARAIFDDLHFANDPDAPTTSETTFPYMSNLGTVDPAAHPDIDCDSLTPIDSSAPSLQELLDAISEGVLALPSSQSNAVLVSGDRTEAGHPIAVFGPQTAYFMPQLLVEKDVHGPGIDARGVSFAGTDLYIQLGRGPDYAWSATSAGGDNIDQWVLELCEPGGGTPTVSSMGYMHDGTCKAIESFNHTQLAKPSAGGLPPICPPILQPDCTPILLSTRIERAADYGPLVARGTLQDGTPIAIATLRSTYQSELASARGFRRVNDPAFMTDGFDSFRQAMGTGVDYTFNWFYIDDGNIGYQHSCKCPQRAQGVDPYLPAWGTGQWDWQGYIPFASQPFELNPARGWLISWNNKQAPGFTSNDREFYYGPTYRSETLQTRLEAEIAGGLLRREDVIDVMEDAGTVDLRGQETLPLLLQVMGATAPLGADPRAQEMRDRLAAWAADAAHRRDGDRNGSYDDPQAPAIMDAWWPRLTAAMFGASSDNAIGHLRITVDDHNRIIHRGSAFQDGLYGHVNQDLRQVLGLPVGDAWSRTYCGGGVLTTCQQGLWDSLSQAAADLESEFADPNVGSWQRAIAYEDVQHSAVGVTNVEAIHWINRPTFQQVVQIGGDADRDGCLDKQEGGLDPTQGGLRDPFFFWDYGDMPLEDPPGSASYARNRMIRVDDILAVVNRYFADDAGGTAAVNRNSDPLSAPPANGYHPAFDRGKISGPHPWNVLPPDGKIRVGDILTVVRQYFHDCA